MKVEKGNNVKVHYTGTLEDGQEFDSSRKRGETLNFTVGTGQMIPGFDSAVEGMTVGEVKDITLDSTQAYGERKEEAVIPVSRNNFPEDFKVEIFDLLGKKISEYHNLKILDLKELDKGTYIIKISSAYNSQSKLFIKK